MNDPNKVIDVNLSSLLSLKAELLRKQSEVSEAKASRTNASEYISNKSTANSQAKSKDDIASGKEKKDKNGKKGNKEERKDGQTLEVEDSSLLEKSRRVLEAKAKFYERMSQSGGHMMSDENCLVNFGNKNHVKPNNVGNQKRSFIGESDSSSEDEAYDDSHDNDDDWVEYTDCLGRTRKCLRVDLESAKKRDAELAASMPERIDQNKANWLPSTNEQDETAEGDEIIGPMPTESLCSELTSMVSKQEEQRANWERVEQENLDKKDVHYQDVFFDEARQHGVGYYAFSTDEEERRRQQKELEDAREKTIKEQQQRDALRAQREKIIAERVLAAKNRQRARLGLPPLEKEEEKVEEKTESKEERKARKKEEKLKRKLEKLEKQRESERQEYIRPWDEEKDGVPKTKINDPNKSTEEEEWSYKPERTVMSQEEWNEYKRKERNPDFAPPTQTNFVKPKRTNFASAPPVNNEVSFVDYSQMPPPPPTGFSTFQTSKRIFQRKNYEAENPEELQSNDRSGVCIPPPQDLNSDYTLPPKRAKTNVDLERSIEAGLRFIRDSCDKGTFSTKSSWTAKADY